MSGFLLDTNVISDLSKPRPTAAVAAWIDSVDENLLHLSVLTFGEIRKGIAAMAVPSRRAALEAWLEQDVRFRFTGRVLEIDEAVADRWGWLAAQGQLRGRPLPVIDGLLAATALHHNLTLVTRNVKDVAATGVQVFSPWSG